MAAAARAALSAHVHACFYAHCTQPLALALAAASAPRAAMAAAAPHILGPGAAGAGAGASADAGADVDADAALARLAAACGAAPRALAEALDPRLLRLKRSLVALAGCLDFCGLRSAASWPPGARAAWAGACLRARSPRALLAQGFARLEGALRADDACADAGAPLVYTGGGADAADRARSTAPALPRQAWLGPDFVEHCPTPEAAAACATLPALALRLQHLAATLLRPGGRAAAARSAPDEITMAAPPPVAAVAAIDADAEGGP